MKINDHTGPLFYNQKILPFDLSSTQCKLHFMQAIHYNYAPGSFANVFTKNANRDIDYILRNVSSCTIPPVRMESFKRFPLYTFPKLWNELGDHLSYKKNKITFQIALKSELLQQILLWVRWVMSESTLYDPFAIFLQLLCPHLSQCHPSLFPPLFLSYDPNFVSILYPILNPSVLGLTNGSWLKTEILSLHQAPCPAQSTSYLTKDVKLSIKVYVQVQPLSHVRLIFISYLSIILHLLQGTHCVTPVIYIHYPSVSCHCHPLLYLIFVYTFMS